MERMRFGYLFAALTLVILIGSMIPVMQPASASTGSFTVSPGQTKYIDFGFAIVDSELLWNINIDYLGGSLTYWLEKPLGSHVTISYLDYWGELVDENGVWKIGFNVASGGFWTASITYGSGEKLF